MHLKIANFVISYWLYLYNELHLHTMITVPVNYYIKRPFDMYVNSLLSISKSYSGHV